jgi:hypothetical protein
MTIKNSAAAACCLLLLAIGPTLFAQDSGHYLSLEVLGNYYDRLDITRNYTAGTAPFDIRPLPASGAELRLAYGFAVSERISFEAGFLFGLQPQAFNLQGTIELADPSVNAPFNRDVKSYDLIHFGALAHGQYKLPLTKDGKYQLGFRLGAALTYHPFWAVDYSMQRTEELAVFRAIMEANRERRALVSPQGGIHLHYAINERFSLKGGGNFLYSRADVLDTPNGFRLNTGATVLNGKYRIKFGYVGFGLGLDCKL